VIDALARKTRAALRLGEGRFRSLGISGGVANNRSLRAELEREAAQAKVSFFAALPRHTGDNAGMIAFAAWVDRRGTDAELGLALRIEPSAAIV
jgi:N6-L-threonylcarbamoyladenine synthase